MAVCYARRCSAPAILAAGAVDACALLCLYPVAVSVIGASAPGARTPCARTIGSIAPSGIGSSVGQLSAVCRPSVGCLAGLRRSGYGAMLAAGGSPCRWRWSPIFAAYRRRGIRPVILPAARGLPGRLPSASSGLLPVFRATQKPLYLVFKTRFYDFVYYV